MHIYFLHDLLNQTFFFFNCQERGIGFSYSTSLKTGPGFALAFPPDYNRPPRFLLPQREMVNGAPPGAELRRGGSRSGAAEEVATLRYDRGTKERFLSVGDMLGPVLDAS